MRKLLTFVCLSALILGCFTASISAEDLPNDEVPEGFESLQQYEQYPDWFSPERIASRNAKMEAASKEKNKLRNGKKYTIDLPLRNQNNTYYFALDSKKNSTFKIEKLNSLEKSNKDKHSDMQLRFSIDEKFVLLETVVVNAVNGIKKEFYTLK